MEQIIPQIRKMYLKAWETSTEDTERHIRNMVKTYKKYNAVRIEVWQKQLANGPFGYARGLTIVDEEMIDCMAQVLKQAILASGGTIEWVEEENIKGNIDMHAVESLLATKGINLKISNSRRY